MKHDLVFEGGGAKGMAFVGAYEAFVEQGHSYGRLLGTSAGAITAALVAAGYTPEEMLAALNERENDQPVFAGFMGPPAPFTREEIREGAIRTLLHKVNITALPDFLEERLDDAIVDVLAQDRRTRHLFALVERGGWFGADRFLTWLAAKLDSGPWKEGQRSFSQMSLAAFYAETEVDLSLVAADTTSGRLLVLNHGTAPDCPLTWAVRMSMSIPLVWNEVAWAPEWGQYLGRSITGHAIVDGGLLSNFPIELFLSDEPQVTRLMGPKTDAPVLGLLIDESLPVPSRPRARGPLVTIDVKPAELQTVQRLLRLADTATGAHDKMVLDQFEHLVVRLPARGYGTTEFDMTEARRKALVDAGRDAVRAHFARPRVAPGRPGGAWDREEAERAKRIADRMATKLLSE